MRPTKRPTKRLVRVAACTATAAVLTVATGAGNAAAADGDLLYQGTTSTGVVQLTLKLPTALSNVPNPAVLTLLGTEAQAFHGKTAADIATAKSYLAGGGVMTTGPLATVLAPLNRTVTASLSAPGEHSLTAVSVPSNPLGLEVNVGVQRAAVDLLTRLTTSGGDLTSAKLGSIRALGLGTSLDTALTTLTTAIQALVTQSSSITTTLGGLPSLPSVSIPNPLSGVVPGAPPTISTPVVSGATLADTVTGLPAQVQAILTKLTDGAAVSLTTVATGQSIKPGVSSLVSSGSTNALDLTLFGGLVDVSATKAAVAATAATVSSNARAAASATLLSVKISTGLTDLLTLVASDKGITAGLLDGTLLGSALDPLLVPVVTQVDTALNDVLSQLTTLLQSLNSGAKLIRQGTVTKSVSADGKSAEAHAVPAQVTLGLPVAPDLLTLTVGKADAVSALSVVAPTVAPRNDLPKTGASGSAALLALTLVALAAGTFLLRRRQQA